MKKLSSIWFVKDQLWLKWWWAHTRAAVVSRRFWSSLITWSPLELLRYHGVDYNSLILGNLGHGHYLIFVWRVHLLFLFNFLTSSSASKLEWFPIAAWKVWGERLWSRDFSADVNVPKIISFAPACFDGCSVDVLFLFALLFTLSSKL